MAMGAYNLTRPLQGVDGTLLTLSTPATVIGNNWDEDHLDGIAIGFTFEFNGVPYTTINVDVNGWASLSGTPTSRPDNTSFNALENTILLAPWWDNLGTFGSPAGEVKTETQGSGPNRTFIVQWSVTHGTTSSSSHFDKCVFQIVLYETTNKIEFRYADFTTTGAPTRTSYSATVGVKVDTTGGLDDNHMDFFGTSIGSARTDLLVRNDALTVIDWPGNAGNGAGLGGAYNFHLDPAVPGGAVPVIRRMRRF